MKHGLTSKPSSTFTGTKKVLQSISKVKLQIRDTDDKVCDKGLFGKQHISQQHMINNPKS